MDMEIYTAWNRHTSPPRTVGLYLKKGNVEVFNKGWAKELVALGKLFDTRCSLHNNLDSEVEA